MYAIKVGEEQEKERDRGEERERRDVCIILCMQDLTLDSLYTIKSVIESLPGYSTNFCHYHFNTAPHIAKASAFYSRGACSLAPQG